MGWKSGFWFFLSFFLSVSFFLLFLHLFIALSLCLKSSPVEKITWQKITNQPLWLAGVRAGRAPLVPRGDGAQHRQPDGDVPVRGEHVGAPAPGRAGRGAAPRRAARAGRGPRAHQGPGRLRHHLRVHRRRHWQLWPGLRKKGDRPSSRFLVNISIVFLSWGSPFFFNAQFGLFEREFLGLSERNLDRSLTKYMIFRHSDTGIRKKYRTLPLKLSILLTKSTFLLTFYCKSTVN